MARRDPAAPIGSHAGRMLQDLITRSIVDSRSAMIPAEREHTRRLITDLLDDWEGPTGQIAMDFLAPLREVQDTVPGLEDFLDRLDHAENATDWFASLIGAIVGSISTVLQVGQIYYRGFLQQAQATYPTVPLSPADAADAVERAILDEKTGKTEAAKSGVGAQVFDWQVALTGEPPGLVDMLRLWRRGDLDEKTLRRMVAYSRVRTEWTDYVLHLATEVPSGADIVEGYIKGLLTFPEAEQKYYEAGGRKSDFAFMAEAAGEPIGVVAAGRLFDHHLISQEDLDSVVRYSRINPRFEQIALLQRLQFLSVFQISNALRSGAATPAQATEWLLADGYPPDQVAALVKGTVHGSAVKAKTLTESIILDNYEAGLATKKEASAQLVAIGYPAAQVAMILESYDARKILTLIQQGITVVRRGFLAGTVSVNAASSDLDALGVLPEVRDHYLKLWELERKVDTKALTMAQIGDMFKAGEITEQYAVKRWIALGYPPSEAALLAYRYGKPLPDGKPVA